LHDHSLQQRLQLSASNTRLARSTYPLVRQVAS
jgi:hypothetical protein